MTTMEDRERAFEAKFSLDLELAFRSRARMTQLVALWAATRMGLAGDRAQDYAKRMVFDDVEARGHGDIAHRVIADMTEMGVEVTEGDVAAEIEKLMPRVRKEIYGDALP